MRLEVDQKPAAVERRIGTIHADEGRQAVDVGILQNNLGERPLAIGHATERDRLPGFADTLDQAGVLYREKSLWDGDVESGRNRQGNDGDGQRYRLMVENEAQSRTVMLNDGVEPLLVLALEPVRT